MKSCITVSLVEEARGGPFVLWDDLESACRTASELGFDAIEVFPPGPEAIDVPKLTRLLGDYGLALAAVGTGAGWVKHRLQVADADAVRRRQAADFIRSIIDVAAPFGAFAIIGSMQGRHGDGVSRERARGYLSEALETCGQHAAQYDLPLVYEPLNRYETNQINTVADGAALIRGLATTNVRLLCDLFHMQIEESDVGEALVAAGDLLGHVHFVDSNRRPVGQGHTDFRPIMAALAKVGYTGWLSAEAFPWPDSLSAARRTMEAFQYWSGRR